MQAQAQTVETLVSNIDETLVSGTSSAIQAQRFTTGSHADGYTISEVRIRLATWTGNRTTSVRIKTNVNNLPGALVAELMNPSPLAKNSVNTFTAPDGHDASTRTRTTGSVVNEGVGSSRRVSLRRTHSNDETGEAGWSIADNLRWRTSNSNNWSSDPNPRLSMEIKGRAFVTDATLGSPEFFVQEHAHYYADLTYRFDLTLTEAVSTPHHEMRDHAFEVTNGLMVKAKAHRRGQRPLAHDGASHRGSGARHRQAAGQPALQ